MKLCRDVAELYCGTKLRKVRSTWQLPCFRSLPSLRRRKRQSSGTMSSTRPLLSTMKMTTNDALDAARREHHEGDEHPAAARVFEASRKHRRGGAARPQGRAIHRRNNQTAWLLPLPSIDLDGGVRHDPCARGRWNDVLRGSIQHLGRRYLRLLLVGCYNLPLLSSAAETTDKIRHARMRARPRTSRSSVCSGLYRNGTMLNRRR
jgi:hypothetical protein